MPAEACVALKPSRLSYDEAAAIPHGGLAALHFLRAARIAAGQNVLVNGASGAVGTVAVQVAKHLGADVTGVCGPAHLDLVKELGADRVIDYSQADFTKGDTRYDIILDTVSINGLRRCRPVLSPTGTLVILFPNPRKCCNGPGQCEVGGSAW